MHYPEITLSPALAQAPLSPDLRLRNKASSLFFRLIATVAISAPHARSFIDTS